MTLLGKEVWAWVIGGIESKAKSMAVKYFFARKARLLKFLWRGSNLIDQKVNGSPS